MYLKPRMSIAIGILCLIGVVLFWRLGGKHDEHGPSVATLKTNSVPLLSLQTNAGSNQAVASGPSSQGLRRAGVATLPGDTNTPFRYRISNTTRKIDELLRSESAILLRNALIDGASGRPLYIPAHLRSQGDPGSYIVQ